MADFGFAPIIGQEGIRRALQDAAANGRPAHAYILEGPAGSGRKMMADAFAMTLECEAVQADPARKEPCGKCHSCIQFLSKNHPDVMYLHHEKASIGVTEIREQIVGDAQIRPYSGKYKVYIVPDAELMTVQAQNALLKTLEEPPEYAVILLLTQNADTFLPTILSRCLRFRMRPLPDEVITAQLMALPDLPENADVAAAAAFAQGSLGQAFDLVRSEAFQARKQIALRFVREAKTMNVRQMTDLFKDLETADYRELVSWIRLWYRDVLAVKACPEGKGPSLSFAEEEWDIIRQAKEVSFDALNQIIEEIRRTELRLAANVSPDNAMELLLLTLQESGNTD